MENLKIAQKLYVGFGITMALSLVVGVVAYSGLGTVSGAADESDLCANVAKSVLSNQVKAEQFSLKANPEALPEIDKQTAAAEKALQDWTNLTTDPNDLNSIRQMGELVRSWKSSFDEYVTLRKEMGFSEKDGLQKGCATQCMPSKRRSRHPNGMTFWSKCCSVAAMRRTSCCAAIPNT